MELYVVVVGVIIVAAMVLGSYFTQRGLRWYHSELKLPLLTPPDWVFAPIWTFIYALVFVCMAFAIATFERTISFWLLSVLFMCNMFLNIFWSYLFFKRKTIGYSVLDAFVLTITVYGMMFCVAQHSFAIMLLLLPYALWSSYAFFLDYRIWMLNKN